MKSRKNSKLSLKQRLEQERPDVRVGRYITIGAIRITEITEEFVVTENMEVDHDTDKTGLVVKHVPIEAFLEKDWKIKVS